MTLLFWPLLSILFLVPLYIFLPQQYSYVLSLFLGLITSAYFFYKTDASSLKSYFIQLIKNNTTNKKCIYLIFFVPSIFVLGFFLLDLVFVSGDTIYVGHPNNLGDIPYHIHLTKYLSHASFWPDNPIFSNSKIVYPFALNLWQSMWLHLGLDILFILKIVSIIFISFSVAILFLWQPLLFFGVFFAGSLPFFYSDVVFKSTFLSLFLTQRSFLYSLPLALLFYKKAFEVILNKTTISKQDLALWSILLGFLAYVHSHAFLALAVILLLLSLIFKEKYLALILLFSSIMASPWFIYIKKSVDFSPYFQWMAMYKSNFLVLEFIFNFLPFLVLLIFCLFRYKKRIRLLFLSLLVLLFIFQNLIFAPWPWDNIKIIFFIYLATLTLFFMIEKNLYIKIVFSFFLSLGGFSQIVDYIFKYNPQKIYSINENKKFKNFVLKNSSSNYMVYPTYNHPLSFYGLKLVCGYQGHLWSHAIDYKGRCDDVVNIYLSKDAPSRSKLKELGVDYLVLSGFENKHSRWLNMPDFDLAFQYEDLVIYSIR